MHSTVFTVLLFSSLIGGTFGFWSDFPPVFLNSENDGSPRNVVDNVNDPIKYHFLRPSDITGTMARKFVLKLNKAIASGDTAEIGKPFSSKFILHGCNGLFNKNQTVELLSQPVDNVMWQFEYIKFRTEDKFVWIYLKPLNKSDNLEYVLEWSSIFDVVSNGVIGNCPQNVHQKFTSHESILDNFY
ncbi:hypothetical protein GCK72_022951 [Caenorhabditis remanei]|uniref:NTF2-like domain-containing protein n=1 Tax=Caenorhabditis remanei TaxID=31234 RepID=A0A6A5FVF7_CAERE|nr:hypothetical protein GCK72_022951 [Caenorhabditis remanei]KAF1746495.1 hypothetical protein GCK72_022951 [Caenorhabditis remanei]